MLTRGRFRVFTQTRQGAINPLPDNLFTLPELRLFFEEHRGALPAIAREPVPGLKEFAQQLLSTGDVREEVADRVNLADSSDALIYLENSPFFIGEIPTSTAARGAGR